MMESSEIKKEKIGDDMKTHPQEVNAPDMTEQQSVKVEFASCATLAKADKDVEKTQIEKNNEADFLRDDEQEGVAETFLEKEAEVVKESDEEVCGKLVGKEEDKEAERDSAKEKWECGTLMDTVEEKVEDLTIKDMERNAESDEDIETEMIKGTEAAIVEIEYIDEKEPEMAKVTEVVSKPEPEAIREVKNMKELEPETVKDQKAEIVEEPELEAVKEVENVKEKEREMAKVPETVKEPEPETVKGAKNINEEKPETVTAAKGMKEEEPEMAKVTEVVEGPELETVKEVETLKETEREMAKKADFVEEKETEMIKAAELLKETGAETDEDKDAKMVEKSTDKEKRDETEKTAVHCEKELDADYKKGAKGTDEGKDEELEMLEENVTVKKTEGDKASCPATETADKMGKLERLPDTNTETKEVNIKAETTGTAATNKEEAEQMSTAKGEQREAKEGAGRRVAGVEKSPEMRPAPGLSDAQRPHTKADVEPKMAAAAEAGAAGAKAPLRKPHTGSLGERTADRGVAEKKDGKKDTPAKRTNAAGSRSSAAPSRDLQSADKKTKPAVGASKLNAAPKARLGSACAGSSVPPRPGFSSSGASDRRPAAAKAPPAAPKRPSSTAPGACASSASAASRDPRAKTSAETRAPVPKTGAAVSTAATTKARTASAAAPKPPAPARAAPPARSSVASAARRTPASTIDTKAGVEKRPSATRTSPAEASKSKSTATSTTRSSATATNRPRGTTAKPATPLSSTAPEKKAAGLRPARTAFIASTSIKTSAQAGSKAGPTDNAKHAPGGAKPEILNKKLDLSKVTSKCGSKDNIKHKPGGGNVKIGSHKASVKEKAQSKVGSVDTLGCCPGGGSAQAEGAEEKTEGSGAATPVSGREAALAESPGGHRSEPNGAAPCPGVTEPPALDSHIPETSI